MGPTVGLPPGRLALTTKWSCSALCLQTWWVGDVKPTDPWEDCRVPWIAGFLWDELISR